MHFCYLLHALCLWLLCIQKPAPLGGRGQGLVGNPARLFSIYDSALSGGCHLLSLFSSFSS